MAKHPRRPAESSARRKPPASSETQRTAEQASSRLPLRLIQIATDILRREGHVKHIDHGWITLHLSLTPSPKHR